MSWPSVPLGEVFEIARGGSPRPIDRFITNDPDGLNWVKIGDATASGKYILSTKEKIRKEGLTKTRAVEPGDFLLTNSMSFGRPYIMGTHGCIHDGWLVLKPREVDTVSQDYMYHVLGSNEIRAMFASRAPGSTVKNLNSTMVAETSIPLPPLDEQRRIAGILDAADALRRRRREALALLDTLPGAIFAEMFGDPSDNPHGIATGTISDLLDDVRYGTSNKAGAIGKLPILRMGNITYEGRMDLDDLKRIDLPEKDIPKHTVRNGDILFNRTNSADLVGKTAIFREDEPYAFAGYLVRARVRDGNTPEYVAGYLNSPHGKKVLRNMAKNIVGMANINAKEMQSIPILLAAAEEQRLYAERCSKIDEQREVQMTHLSQLDSLFASLQSRAFAGDL